MNTKLVILIGLAVASCAEAATFSEDFSADPGTHGWKIHGNTNLFGWDAANQNLRVTWDSSQPNSYFYLLLGTILSRSDDFSLALDLQLEDIAAGKKPKVALPPRSDFRPWAEQIPVDRLLAELLEQILEQFNIKG